MSKRVAFQTTQFSISTQFKLSKAFLFQAIQICQTVLIQTIQFSICTQLVLFNSLTGPCQMLSIRVRVDLGAMAMNKKYLDLAREQKKVWNMKASGILIVVDAFGMFLNGLEKCLKELEI